MSKTNLENYLSYYQSLNSPGFAVLVVGEWGSGKTYQVLKAITPSLQCHVSLFGIDNAQEVYTTVFAKMYPGKNFAKKLIDLTKDVSVEIGGITSGAGSLIGNALGPLIKQTVDKDKIIIFDDLERCAIPNNDILGVINQYVEHHQCRVIIIAHDKKTHDNFITTKEKIVGHTIKVEPQIDDAAKHFFPQNYHINNYSFAKPIILDAFKKTECKSLRILKSVIGDCNRLIRCLEPTHIKNQPAMQALFNHFCIVNIEFRLGNLDASNLKIFPKSHLEYLAFKSKSEKASEEEQKKAHNIIKFISKYPTEDIRTPIIRNELLAIILETGSYPKKEIIDSVNISKYFFQNIKHPAWVTIINFDSLDSYVVRQAIEEMFDSFRNFEIIEIEDLMHSFCLTYMLSEINEVNMSFDDIYSFQCEYIKNLLDKGLLPPAPLLYDPFSDNIYRSARNYTYWIKDSYSGYVDEVVKTLKESRKESQIKKRPEYAKEILIALEKDVELFKSLIIGDGTISGKYSTIDILSQIPPEDFVIYWLTLPVDSWNRIADIFISRYSNGSLLHLLNGEKLWLREVNLCLIFEAKRNKGIDRARIERLFPHRVFIEL